jgi:nucleotide-binding universal stress UspA family protein
MTQPIHTLVFGLAEMRDGDPHFAEALRTAERLGATLHVVHAFQLPDPMVDGYGGMIGLGPEEITTYREAQRERVESFVRAEGGGAGGARVVCHAEPGPADRVLLAVAARVRADLLLVGATRRGTLARTILGTTAQRVVRGAHVPLLVMREPITPPATRSPRVLLTTDLSPLSAAVQERGLDTVAALWDEVPEMRALLVVWHEAGLSSIVSAERLLEAATNELDAYLAARRPRGRPVEAAVAVGDPAKEIVREAAEWGADMLVLGTHGRSGTSRLLLGSVAESVLRTVLGNVLVVPASCVSEAVRAGEAAP